LLAASGTRGPTIRQAFGEKTDTGFQLRFAYDASSGIALQPYFSSSMVLRI
jgi:hypothetical protein